MNSMFITAVKEAHKSKYDQKTPSCKQRQIGSSAAQVYNFGSATSHSKLSVLRICNQLLRRLSRASSSELCGRILMFLTRLLPLLDRSGLNVQGQFNTSHSTPVEDVPEVSLCPHLSSASSQAAHA